MERTTWCCYTAVREGRFLCTIHLLHFLFPPNMEALGEGAPVVGEGVGVSPDPNVILIGNEWDRLINEKAARLLCEARAHAKGSG